MNLKKSKSLLMTLGMSVALLGVMAGSAQGTFPAKNGRIAFLEGPDIYTMNPDGSDERQLTAFGPDDSACCVNWSPDGRQIIFVLFTPTTQGQIWTMKADGTNQQLLLDDPSALPLFPSYSPDGQYVVFSRCPPADFFQCGISRIRADGTNLSTITAIDPNPDIIDFSPAYSPDGKTISFNSFYRDGVLEAVYLMNADGSHIRRLTPPEIGASQADWSPNGANLVFFTNDPSCGGGECFFPNPEIWMINSDGTGVRPVTISDNFLDFSPAWSPQGTAIVFERDASDFSTAEIYVVGASESGLNSKLIRRGLARRTTRLHDLAQATVSRPGKTHQLKLIEDDGSSPRWGPAPR